MDTPNKKPSDHWKNAWISWDPYDVWQRILKNNPVCVADPSGTTGQMDSGTARGFWATVAEFPDPLQDVLFVIAHAEGFQSALSALDHAIGEHLADRAARSKLVPLERKRRAGKKKVNVAAANGRKRAAS